MTDDWQTIESAPKDGSNIWVKRVYENRIVAEGWAVFGVCHRDAPQRQSLGIDLLGRLDASDYAREGANRSAYVEAPKWLKPDRMYSFPNPTHWSPGQTAPVFDLVTLVGGPFDGETRSDPMSPRLIVLKPSVFTISWNPDVSPSTLPIKRGEYRRAANSQYVWNGWYDS